MRSATSRWNISTSESYQGGQGSAESQRITRSWQYNASQLASASATHSARFASRYPASSGSRLLRSAAVQ